MYDHLLSKITKAAIAEAPRELCGYIIEDECGTFFYRATNVIPEDPKAGLSPREAFAITVEERAHVESLGEIKALVHSHTNATELNGKTHFSAIDIAACNRGDIPWLLVTLTEDLKPTIQWLNPTQGSREPLIGREWAYGVLDCYSLIRDAIAEAGVNLKDYPRTLLSDWTNDKTLDLYEQHFRDEGFIEVDLFGQFQKYDLLFMCLRCDRINHAGIVCHPERNIFLHHLANHLSSEDVYGGYWQKNTVKVVRHSSLF